MKHAKKSMILLTSGAIVLILALPLMTPIVDAASVLETEAAATIHIGDSFQIVARGRGGVVLEDMEDFEITHVTHMTLDFKIIRRSVRGVVFDPLNGHLSLNDTTFEFDDGIGIAGHPKEGRLNKTIIFGFRINVTGPNGEVELLEFRGQVRRTQEHGPLLLMRGRVILEDTTFVFGQVGRIHRI